MYSQYIHNNVIIIDNSLMNLTFLCLWDFILFVQYKLPPPQALLIESSNRCGRKFRDAQAVLTLAGKAMKRLLNNAAKMARRL